MHKSGRRAQQTHHSFLRALLFSMLMLSIGCESREPPPQDTAKTLAEEAPKTSQKPTLSFGIVPQQSASKLAKLWTPILKHVSEESGVELRFETAPTIPEFEKRCNRGDYDIAYMNPYHYTVFSKTPGYRAFAKQKDTRIQGILVKKKGSPIDTLNDLDGSALAFPAPKAFAATLLTTAGLNSAKIKYSKNYVSSHDSVYRSVAKGLFPAGGGIVRTLNNLEPEIREQLEVLWRTPTYTPHAIASHSRVTDEQQAKLKRAFLRMETDEVGRRLLDGIKFKGVASASDVDWDDVRGLNIQVD